MRVLLAALAIAAASTTLFPRPAPAAWGDGLFPDAAAHWAAEPLNFLGALDIIRGYPDGKCRPEGPLTALEAVLLLLRAAEYGGGKAAGPALNVPVPREAAWAQKDLALAVQVGILSADELRPEILLEPAPRYLVWVFLARALKVPLDNGATLEFKDAGEVPPGALPAAATLVRLRLIKGFPGGFLRPLQAVTRAEMAALLARMVEEGWLNPAPARRLEGWVQAVKAGGPARYAVTLCTPAGGAADYFLAGNVAVLNAPLPSPYALYNLHVKAVLNGRGELAFLKAGEPRLAGQLSIKTGTVEKVVKGANPQVVIRDLSHELCTYTACWATAVPRGLFSLKERQWVKVALAEQTLWSIEPLEVKRVTGRIAQIDGVKLYLDKEDKNLGRVFLHWQRARLSDKNGLPYSGSNALGSGCKVEITCLDWDKLLEIKIL